MRDGLYAVAVWQGGGRMVLRVAWVRRADGDEYDVAWVTPYRDGYAKRPGEVWPVGPSAAPGWTYSPVIESTALRQHLVPLAILDPEKWASVCPKPEGW